MTEYAAASARALIEGLEPLEIDAPTAENLGAATAFLEGLEETLTRLPAAERRAAVSGVALESGGTLWVPVARNCRRSAGVAVEGDGLLSFAVGDEGDARVPLATHFSARTAAAHALRGEVRKSRRVEANGEPSVPDETPWADYRALAGSVKASGWALPVARRVEDLDPDVLAGVARLSDDGIAHLFAEGGGLVLAMAGSTASDRRRAVEHLPVPPTRPTAARRIFGVLVDAGEASSHYSEREGWGLTGNADKWSPDREAEAAAELFRASRQGSLAVTDTKAERRRIAANRRRLRAEFVSRRRRGEDLAVRPAREIGATLEETREAHWTKEEGLRRSMEQACRSGRTAYDTARAVYLDRLPTLSHRLLHLLRREGGAVREREFVCRRAKLAGAGEAAPEAALRTALRELADAEKVMRLRSRATGEVFLAATEPLDGRRFRRSLNSLIRDPRFGITNPWADVDGAEPEGGEDEEVLLGRDSEDVFPEETGHEALFERVADDGAQEEIEAITA